MRRIFVWVLAGIAYGIFLFYLTFFLSFYATFQPSEPGWHCRPTITFGYHCTSPDGEELTNR